jgi:hypothetical protein
MGARSALDRRPGTKRLRCLLPADAQGIADGSPRGAGPSGLIDVMPDQLVRQVVEPLGGEHGFAEVNQRVPARVLCVDVPDEVIEPDRLGCHSPTVGLALAPCQPTGAGAGRGRTVARAVTAAAMASTVKLSTAALGTRDLG